MYLSSVTRLRRQRSGAVLLAGALVAGLLTIGSAPAHASLAQSDEFSSWTPRALRGAELTLTADSDITQAGAVALRWENETPRGANVYGDLRQEVPVEPATEYEFSAWIRSEALNPSGLQVAMNDLSGWPNRYTFPSGTYEWQQVEWTYTTADDQTVMTFRLISQDVMVVWLDSLTMLETGTTENLLANGGFEEFESPEISTEISSADGRLALVFDEGDAALDVRAEADTVAWELLDYQNVALQDGSAETADGGVELAFPDLAPGLYHLVTTVEVNGRVSTTRAAFAVLAELPDRAWTDESPFGVGAHFMRPPTWDLDLMGVMSQVGIRHMRDEISWTVVETAPGVYTIPARAEEYMARAEAEDINPLFAATYRNQFHDDGLTPWTPEGHQAYADYASAVVQHFGNVDELNVYNEFNGSDRFNDGLCGKTPECYYPLLVATSDQVRADAPDTTIVAPSTSAMSLAWIERLLELGGGDYLDVISTHPYRYPGPPEGLEGDIQTLHQIIADNNDGESIPVWFTELGWPSHTAGISESTQADYTIRSQAISIANGVERFYWYDLLNDGLDPGNAQNHFGMIQLPEANVLSYTPKPNLVAEAALIRAIGGLTPGARDALTPNVFSYPFGSGDETTRTMWATEPSSVSVTAAGEFDVIDRFGAATTVSSGGDPVQVDLTGHPIFIRGDVTVAALESPSYTIDVDEVVSVNDPVTATVTADRSSDQGAPSTVTVEVDGQLHELDTVPGEVTTLEIELAPSTLTGTREIIAIVSADATIARASTTTEVATGTSIRVIPQVSAQDPTQATAGIEVSNNMSVPVDYPHVSWVIGGVSGTTPIGSVPARDTVILDTGIALEEPWQPVSYSAVISPMAQPTVSVSGTTGLNPLYPGGAASPPALDLESNGEAIYSAREYGGPDDLSGTVRLTYSEEYLEVHAEVEDNVFEAASGGPSVLWNGDAMQLATSNGLPGEDLASTEFGFALLDGEPNFYRWLTDESGSAGPLPGAEGTVTREDTTTTYDVRVPWTSIGFTERPDLFSLSLLVADADGSGAREGYIGWGGGIASSKSSAHFRPIVTVPESAIDPCTETLTGSIRAGLDITEGVTCVQDATVSGTVTVAEGAGLIVSGSLVTARFDSVGAGLIDIRESELRGNVTISATSGEVILSGNTFVGRLTCEENASEPSDLDVANTFRGTVSGQCEILRAE